MTTAYSIASYPTNGSTQNFAVPFPYLAKSHVSVYLDGVLQAPGLYTWPSDSLISFAVAPLTGHTLYVKRQTPGVVMDHTVQIGTILPADLNDNSLQLLYLEQELSDITSATNVAWITAQVAAANAAAVSAAASLAAIQAIGAAYPAMPSIFSLINNSTITAGIQAGTYTSALDTYFHTAIAAGGQWYLPKGTYHFAATLTMAPGVEFYGAGIGNTIVFLGGSAGQWGMEMINGNGTYEVEAFKLEGIQFYLSGGINGIRWGSKTHGFTNDASSQAYMFRARLKNCAVLNDQALNDALRAVQMCKVFDAAVEDCAIVGLGVGIEFQGTDISRIAHNRIQACSNASIVLGAQTSFGSTAYVVHNDILNPGLGGTSSATAIITGDRDSYIAENYIEGNVTVTDCIQIAGENDPPFFTTIENNRVEWAAATNFVRVMNTTYAQLPYKTIISGNKTTSALGNIIWQSGKAPYFNNSTGRNYIRVEDNSHITQNAGAIPFQSAQNYAPVPPGYVAQFTTGRSGVAFTGIAAGLLCGSGDFLLPADSDAGHYIEFSDYSLYAPPGNNLAGVYTITMLWYGGTVGQRVNWEILDGTSSLSTGNDTASPAANQIYQATLSAGGSFGTKPVIRIWNNDTATGGSIYIREVAIRYGA